MSSSSRASWTHCKVGEGVPSVWLSIIALLLTAGNHQLEIAQMSIKARVLSEQLDSKQAEVEALAEAHSLELEKIRGEHEAEVNELMCVVHMAVHVTLMPIYSLAS